MMYAASVDIGGTGIKYGLVDENGMIRFKSKRSSEADKGAVHVMENVKLAIKELFSVDKNIHIAGIGIGSAGQIDPINGKVTYATPNIPGYTGTPIKGILEAEYGYKVFVENDVNAAMIGEAWKGAGIGADKVIGLTLGTGIGGCIMYNGRVEHGVWGSAGEFGHMIVKMDGYPCNCGNKGCYEQYASASALIRCYTEKVKNTGGLWGDPLKTSQKAIDAEYIFRQAKSGDLLAAETVEEFIAYLGTGLISLIHVFNPERVIIGGGISDEGESFFQRVEDYVSRRVMPAFLEKLKIVPARLGNDAGIMGAAKLVFDHLDQDKSL